MYIAAWALWAALLILAHFYVRRARHPRSRPLAAYMIFIIVFSVSSFVLFVSLTALLNALGWAVLLANPIAAPIFLLTVFVPAFLIARWQLRKPPREPMQP